MLPLPSVLVYLYSEGASAWPGRREQGRDLLASCDGAVHATGLQVKDHAVSLLKYCFRSKFPNVWEMPLPVWFKRQENTVLQMCVSKPVRHLTVYFTCKVGRKKMGTKLSAVL